MIYYSKELPPKMRMVNLITLPLRDEEDGYIVVSKEVFAEAYRLKSLYPTYADIYKKVAPSSDVYPKDFLEAISEQLPEPLDYISAFLTLVDPTLDFDLEDISVVCGCLHVVTSGLNMQAWTSMSAGLRPSLDIFDRFTLSSYKSVWDDLIREIEIEVEVIVPIPQYVLQTGFMPAGAPQYYGAVTHQTSETITPSEEEVPPVSDENPFDCLEEVFARLEAEEVKNAAKYETSITFEDSKSATEESVDVPNDGSVGNTNVLLDAMAGIVERKGGTN